MKISLPAGKYVVAVSGGIDSVVLLHQLVQLARQPGATLKLVVAHFDHGIRSDSAEDRILAQRLAKKYALPFVYDQANLGPNTSEAKARDARYAFLHAVRDAMHADAIVMAHHQDDLLETVIINLMRGTKSRGLSSLRSTETLRRPLLAYTKEQIRAYATTHKLEWREDSTNDDEAYLRNYIRKNIMPRLDEATRERLLGHSEKAATLNEAIATLTQESLAQITSTDTIDRQGYGALPAEVSLEVLATWLRANTTAQISSKLLNRLDSAIRTGRNSSHIDIAKGYSLKLSRQVATLTLPE